jgi:hypothetical protein
MGYYVTLIESDWRIPERADVLDAVRRIDTDWHELKRGGSYGPNGTEESWFSWMNGDWTDCETVAEVFHMLGFETHTQDGAVNVYGYDNKTGQEDLFLAAVAPFMPDGSYTEWRGEDGSSWRYVVRDGKLMCQEPVVVWPEAKPYRYVHYARTPIDQPLVAVSVDVYSPVSVALQVAAAVKVAV